MSKYRSILGLNFASRELEFSSREPELSFQINFPIYWYVYRFSFRIPPQPISLSPAKPVRQRGSCLPAPPVGTSGLHRYSWRGRGSGKTFISQQLANHWVSEPKPTPKFGPHRLNRARPPMPVKGRPVKTVWQHYSNLIAILLKPIETVSNTY